MAKFSIGVLFIFAQFLLILGKHTSLEPLKCSFDDSQCLETKFASIWDTLMDGIPELGIERLDKMYVGNMSTSYLGLNYKLTNAEQEGLRNSTIERFKLNMRLKMIEVLYRTTLIRRSDYEADGAIFSVPFYGSGKLTTIWNNIRFNAVIFFDVTKHDGKDIIDLKSFIYGFDVKDHVVYECTNSYNGDKEKSDNIHTFMNENWILMSQHFGKDLLDLASNKIFNAFKTYLRHHALEEMFIM